MFQSTLELIYTIVLPKPAFRVPPSKPDPIYYTASHPPSPYSHVNVSSSPPRLQTPSRSRSRSNSNVSAASTYCYSCSCPYDTSLPYQLPGIPVASSLLLETPTASHSTPKRTRTRTQTPRSKSPESPSPPMRHSASLDSPYRNISKPIKDKENVSGNEGSGKTFRLEGPRSSSSFVQALRRSAEEHEHEEPFQLFADNTNTVPAFALELSPILEDLAVFDSMPSLDFDTLDLGLEGLVFPPPHLANLKPSDEHALPEPTLTRSTPELEFVSDFENESIQYPASKSTTIPSLGLGLGNDFARDESERLYQALVPSSPTTTKLKPSLVLQRPSLDEHHLPALTLTKPTPELQSVPVFESVSVTLSPMLKPVKDSDSVSSLMLQPPSLASSRSGSSLSLPRLPPPRGHPQPQPRNRDAIPPPQAPRCTSCGFGFGLGFGSELELSRMPCEMCEEQWVRWVGWYGYGPATKEDEKEKKRRSWFPPLRVPKAKSESSTTKAPRLSLSVGIRKRLSVLVTTSTVTRVDEDPRITWRRRFSSPPLPNKARKRFSMLTRATKDKDLKSKRYSSVGVQTCAQVADLPPPRRPRVLRDSRFIEDLEEEDSSFMTS